MMDAEGRPEQVTIQVEKKRVQNVKGEQPLPKPAEESQATEAQSCLEAADTSNAAGATEAAEPPGDTDNDYEMADASATDVSANEDPGPDAKDRSVSPKAHPIELLSSDEAALEEVPAVANEADGTLADTEPAEVVAPETELEVEDVDDAADDDTDLAVAAEHHENGVAGSGTVVAAVAGGQDTDEGAARSCSNAEDLVDGEAGCKAGLESASREESCEDEKDPMKQPPYGTEVCMTSTTFRADCWSTMRR
jgi:hypothetical protein